MTARDEGVIKFHCLWEKSAALDTSSLQELISVRQNLFALNLIGVYPDGISFGNLSVRINQPEGFIISGSQTGHLLQTTAEHYSLVKKFSIEKNEITCRGPIQASSESLTHAMIYEIFEQTRAVIHVHSAFLWKNLMNQVPTTDQSVPYGTPAMAKEIKRLAKESNLPQLRILVMAGHEDGVIAFAENLTEAERIIMFYLESLQRRLS